MFFSEYFGFPLSVSLNQCSIFVFTCMLLIPGQTGEAWEPSKSNALPKIRKHWIEEYFNFPEHASAAVYLNSSIFWGVTQLRLV